MTPAPSEQRGGVVGGPEAPEPPGPPDRDRTSGGGDDGEERPPLWALLLLALFPFALALAVALLYGWIG